MVNQVKKIFIIARYGITPSEQFSMAAFLITAATCLASDDIRLKAFALTWSLLTVTVLLMTKWLADGSRRSTEILKSLFTKNYVICQKSEADVTKAINQDTAIHLCPTGLLKSEVHNIIGSIMPGETYRAVTHGRMIDLIKKTDNGYTGELKVTVSKLSYKASVRKYEKSLYDNFNCQNCHNEECRIKKAWESDDFSDKEEFFGITIRRMPK